MAQIEPLSRRARTAAEEAHDAFDRAVADGVVTPEEILEIAYRLDVSVFASSASDTAQAAALFIQRGGFGRERVGKFEDEWSDLMSLQPCSPGLLADATVDVTAKAA
ncbi:MAG: hypothetical protein WBA46_19470 [Thermomicrobiales bacterium]